MDDLDIIFSAIIIIIIGLGILKAGWLLEDAFFGEKSLKEPDGIVELIIWVLCWFIPIGIGGLLAWGYITLAF